MWAWNEVSRSNFSLAERPGRQSERQSSAGRVLSAPGYHRGDDDDWMRSPDHGGRHDVKTSASSRQVLRTSLVGWAAVQDNANAGYIRRAMAGGLAQRPYFPGRGLRVSATADGLSAVARSRGFLTRRPPKRRPLPWRLRAVSYLARTQSIDLRYDLMALCHAS
jgi:hypothetical protein